VLIAVDLSPGSESVVTSGIALAADEAAQVTLMHSVTELASASALQAPARWMVPEYRTHIPDAAQRKLEGLVSAIATDVSRQMRIVTGPVAQRILEQSAELNVDLIVVGKSRGLQPLGSTALRVLRKNDRALLVVPAAAADRTAETERLHAA